MPYIKILWIKFKPFLKSLLGYLWKLVRIVLLISIIVSFLMDPYFYLDIPGDIVWMHQNGFSFINILHYLRVLVRLRLSHPFKVWSLPR